MTRESLERSLERAAEALARDHAVRRGPARPHPLLEDTRRLRRWFRDATRALATPAGAAAKTAEWFLDNGYLLPRAARQIEKDMPARFYARLPVLTTTAAAGNPRIQEVAARYLEASDLQVVKSTLVAFLLAYQRATHFTIAELWALPTMLRLGCLEALIAAVHRAAPSLPKNLGPTPCGCSPALDETECVSRALRSLRAVSSIQWREIFQEASVVESVLRQDPAGAYSEMDFPTCDAYRAVVEKIAWRTGENEPVIALRAVEQSRRALGDSPRDHVGFWLVGPGRMDFEAHVGFSPSPGARWRRALEKRAGALYLAAIALGTLLVLVAPWIYLLSVGAGPWGMAIGLLLSVLPASTLAVAATNLVATLLVPPRVLQKLDFSRGIPPACRTAVTMPALIGSAREVERLLDQIERHHLGNPDPSLAFILLTDFTDAPGETQAEDDALLDAAVAGIRRLNVRYGGGGPGPFHLLHRAREWNAAENSWMGRERKRGKLEALNRRLLGQGTTEFRRHEGDEAGLAGVRFVLTLDADTVLPRQTAAKLVGIASHPLNRPRFEDAGGRVTSGYAVVQPRIQTRPESAQRSWLARLLAGDTSIDIYSHAVSDVYQDLLGEGIYVGKGIYDVEAFHRSLEGRVPPNAILSHDLIEGLYARVGLASDVVLYEDCPSHVLGYAWRTHRWIRGDWQLLPWLGPRVPVADGTRAPNILGALDRWKIADNLRRSLVAPGLLALLACGWLFLPGHPAVWTALALLVSAAPTVATLFGAAGRALRQRPLQRATGEAADRVLRWLLFVAFLPHEAFVAGDAVVRTLVRTLATRRHMLEWTTSEHARRALERTESAWAVWRATSAAPVAAVFLGAAMVLLRPDALPWAAPLLIAWLVAPAIARSASRPLASRRESLLPGDVEFLRGVARRTWLYFETFAGPEDQWLPPDNFQEDRSGEVSHRTSPTNIGMLLLSAVAAWDMGYLGTRGLYVRIRNTLETLGRMRRHRGHLLNWYDTRTLEPLAPLYVSTADSGNLAAALLAVAKACEEIAAAPPLATRSWGGLVDGLALLEQAIGDARIATIATDGGSPGELVHAMRREVDRVCHDPKTWWLALERIANIDAPRLERVVLEAVRGAGKAIGLRALGDVRIWLDRSRRHVEELRAEARLLLPWLGWVEAESLSNLGDPHVRLGDVPTFADSVRAQLPDGPDAGSAREALAAASQHAIQLATELRELSQWARAEALGMEFGFLYDKSSHLFHIGYFPDAGRTDEHHYDLLASESRIASFVAIAKGDVPVRHWFFLGRPLRRVQRQPLLVSWGGTMFEYLMPTMLFRSFDDTLLASSELLAVDQQAKTGAARGIPWGMSESGYAAVDAHGVFQYRAFGDPALGLKRGIDEETVVAPYASALALAVRPALATANLRALADLGLLARFGFYEAADFTLERVPEGRRFAPVTSYMAHHQGMILASIDNALHGDPMPRRFHADIAVRTVSMLLHERVPFMPDTESPMPTVERAAPQSAAAAHALPSWSPPLRGRHPEVQVLGNGRLVSLLSDSGAGGIRWQDLAVTRWAPDATLDDRGYWIYLRDEEDGHLWSASRAPVPTTGVDVHVAFGPESVEFHRREAGISTRLEIAVAPSDDIEVRLLTVTNESGRPRRLSATSYLEVVLGSRDEDARHPAFGKLFLEGGWDDSVDAILYTRRPRESGEYRPVLLHRCVVGSDDARVVGAETDRQRFLGRHGDARAPASSTGHYAASEALGPDPIAAIRAEIDLPVGAVRVVAFVTGLGGSRDSVLEIAERYQGLDELAWVFTEAATTARRKAHAMGLLPQHLVHAQQLLSLALYRTRVPHEAVVARERCVFGQARLWGMGISGDHPIVLLRLPHGEDLSLLEELVRIHAHWRSMRWAADLVVLRAAGGGYQDDTADPVRRLLRTANAFDQLGRRGGIHLHRGDHLRPEEHDLLASTAAVVLDAAAGTLEAQMADRHAIRQLAPAFAASRVAEGRDLDPPLPRPVGLLLDHGLGGFVDGGRRYAIHLPPGASTPAPWSNVIAHETFGTLVTESGLGYTWALNSAENRLTPWSNDPILDPPGEAIYLRDEETGEVWSPTPGPCGRRFPCQIAHGADFTEWRQSAFGLDETLRTFVTPDDPVKVVRLRLRNVLDRSRRITATYHADWVLGTTRAAHGIHVRSTYDAEAGALVAQSHWNADFAGRVAFLAADRAPHGFTADRTEFLGREGNRARPEALARWGLSGATPPGADACAAIQVHLELPAYGETEVVFLLGQGADAADARTLIARWRNPEARAAGERESAARAERLLGAVTVHTPDPALDAMLNHWLLHQTVAARIEGRTGFNQPSGAFGFRDQLQDVMALVLVDPHRVRRHILECARHQFEEGDVLHWWHPPSGKGVRTRCSDDLLWLPFVTAHYVTATGDDSVLDEPVAFLAGPLLGDEERQRFDTFSTTDEKASLFEHCRRAVERGTTSGAHGLPLMLDGDWNDGMNRIGWRGEGESVWLAWFAIATLAGFKRLCERRGEAGLAARWSEIRDRLVAAVEHDGWDGEWYLRAYDDEGHAIGSAAAEECRIDSIAQSWSVLSGAGDPERARRAVAAAARELWSEDEGLVCLFWPPFDVTPQDPGYVKAYPPGRRENGGHYGHAAAWLGCAFAALGDGDSAVRVLRAILPTSHTRTADDVAHYGGEPYAIAGDISTAGRHRGRAGWTWYTGAAAWAWRLGVEGVLGLRLVEGQLQIAPALPPSWAGYKAEIRIGGGVLAIEVDNTSGAGHGIAVLSVDGEAGTTNMVALPPEGTTRRVRVVLAAK